MSYYSAFKIKDTSGLKVPVSFLTSLSSTDLDEQISILENLSDDVMTVKQSKELQDLKKQKENLTVKISDSFSVSRNVSDNSFCFSLEYNDTVLSLELDEFATLVLSRSGDFFIGDGKLYSVSNYGSSLDILQTFIKEFNGSAIIEDMGDEEYGYVDEDGCNRDLSPDSVWENGKSISS